MAATKTGCLDVKKTFTKRPSGSPRQVKRTLSTIPETSTLLTSTKPSSQPLSLFCRERERERERERDQKRRKEVDTHTYTHTSIERERERDEIFFSFSFFLFFGFWVWKRRVMGGLEEKAFGFGRETVGSCSTGKKKK